MVVLRPFLNTRIDNVKNLSVTAQDPDVAARISNEVISRLQTYVTNYRTEKARQDLEYYQKTVLRHEIIHAFLFESGLAGSCNVWDGSWAENEEMVDWIAMQLPKIIQACKEADAL